MNKLSKFKILKKIKKIQKKLLKEKMMNQKTQKKHLIKKENIS